MKTLLKPENIAFVLTGDEDVKDIRKFVNDIGWIELRLDIFIENHSQCDILKWVKKIRAITDTKIIGTVRWHREKQDNKIIIPDSQRLQLYKNILNFIDFVDVEIKSKIAHCVIEEANKKNKKVIASYHNFQQTPSEKILIHICQDAKKLNVDIVKIATLLKRENDLFTLVSVINRQRKRIPIVVIPMGSSILQRLVPIAFGSQFTYVSLNKKTAPGQPDIMDII